MTVFSTSQLVDAIANQEPDVCLASGYYPLEAQLDLTRSIHLTAVEPGTVRIDAQGSEAVPRRVMRVWKGATVVLTGLVLTGGVAPKDLYTRFTGQNATLVPPSLRTDTLVVGAQHGAI